MKYGIGIPTRNREQMLGRTLKAIIGQSLPPALIVVVDNNDAPLTGRDKAGDVEIVRVRCDFPTTGPEQGHQTALRIFAARGLGVGVRWDDDLVPDRTTLEALVRRIDVDGCVGCGGMYPRPGEARRSGPKGVPDGNPRHLQFFPWDHEAGGSPLMQRKHLYSSFAYSVPAALRAGGFCVEYSRSGYHGETDFTLRLAREGKLFVDAAAMAWHYWSPGGQRGIGNEERMAMADMDIDLFTRRMIAHGIDPEKW